MIEIKSLEKIAKYIDSLVAKADYTVNGITYPAEFRRAYVQDNTVVKQVYLTTKDPIGDVTRVRLFDKDGDLFDQNLNHYTHEKNKGKMFVFKYTVQEVQS